MLSLAGVGLWCIILGIPAIAYGTLSSGRTVSGQCSLCIGAALVALGMVLLCITAIVRLLSGPLVERRGFDVIVAGSTQSLNSGSEVGMGRREPPEGGTPNAEQPEGCTPSTDCKRMPPP